MDPQREQQLAQAAQQLAGAVYHFLQQAAAACNHLNTALFAAQATAPLPVHLPLIPVPPAALPLPDIFSTPVKQSAPKSVSFPHLDSSPLGWSPMALFQASLQQHTLPFGGLTPTANGPTRSTARAGAGAARRGGQHSPPKQPPPLFGSAQQAQQAGTLQHWKSEVSGNMAALSPLPNGMGGGLPAAAADPISPRAAALMAACQEAEHAPPARLVRLTSNLSSAAEAVAGDAPGPSGQQLAKQRSDLAELARMAEEESRAAAAAAAAAAAGAVAAAAAADVGAAADGAQGVAPSATPTAVAAAEGGASGQAPAIAAAGAWEPAGAEAVQQQPPQGGQEATAKRPAEDGRLDEQTAAKRQRSSSNRDGLVAEAAEQAVAQPVEQEAAGVPA